jgi:uncharacterized membrane protein YpjA
MDGTDAEGGVPSDPPAAWVEYYLGNGPSLAWLLVVNGVAFLVGVSFYVHSDPSLRDVSAVLYPLFGDSPTALALVTLSLATLLANLGRPVREAPVNRPLAYLHTLAFVWLVKYGVWTVLALNLQPSLYVGFTLAAIQDYWFIVFTHALFVAEAFVIPYYGRTTRGALALAAVLLSVNDAVDYGLGLYPPLRYDPFAVSLAGVPVLPVVTVGLTVGSVALAARVFDPLEPDGTDPTPDRSD